MARRLPRLSVPFKLVVDRMTVSALVAVSLMLLVIGKADLKLIDALATGAGDIASPALRLVSAPVEAVRGVARSIGQTMALAEENARLQSQVDRLLGWQAEATRLAVENRELRIAAAMPVEAPAMRVATAAIVGDSAGSFVQTRLIDAGSARGVAVGHAVVDEAGLVGRVVAVGRQSSRVLLITDPAAKVPVMVEGSGDRALMEGDGGRRLRLRFLPRDPRFQLGDRVVTSGEGGLIPPGIAVGVISRVGAAGVEVSAYVDWGRLDYVQVLRAQPIEAPEADGADLAVIDASAVAAGAETIAATGPVLP